MKQLLFLWNQTEQILQCNFLSPAALFKNKKSTNSYLLSTVQRWIGNTAAYMHIQAGLYQPVLLVQIHSSVIYTQTTHLI